MLASVDPDPVCDRQDHSCLVRTRSWQEEYHAVSSQKNPTERDTSKIRQTNSFVRQKLVRISLVQQKLAWNERLLSVGFFLLRGNCWIFLY